MITEDTSCIIMIGLSRKITNLVSRPPPGGWISVEDELPEVGTIVKCRVDYYRHGQAVISGEEIYAEYRGMNESINKPLFDIKTYGEAYADVTHWQPSKEGE